jgi:type VI secretion system protein ImpA
MNNTILNPISDTSPTGSDLSFSPAFDQIAELRRFDDPTLDQGEWVRDFKSADWPGVARLCSDLLTNQTKDLRLAGWMTEALSRTRGFAGMAEGLNACAGLCETFWSDLHPMPDEDAPASEPAERFEQRIGNLKWLLTQLAEVAQTQPLIVGKAAAGGGGGSGGGAYGRRVIEAVRSRKASEYESTTEPTEEQIALALTQTPGDVLLASLDGTQAALDALARLQTVIDGHLGVHGPNFSAVRDALKDTQHMLTRFAKERGLLAQTSVTDTGSPTDTGAAMDSAPSAAGTGFTGSAPASRAQALAQLRAVAEFFRRTEPHSPVAYLADKAAKWGDVPLHLWLRSVMKDQASLAQIEEMLGIDPPPPQE